MAARTYSLRWRLILLISIPVLIAGIVIGALGFFYSWHEIEEVYDAQLIHSAKVLHQLTKHELKEHEETTIDLLPKPRDWGYKYEQNIAFRIWQDQRLITGSNSAEAFHTVSALPGLSDQVINGEKWRFFVYIDSDSNITVETAERYAIRYELIEYLTLGLLLPASLFIPAVLLLVWFGATRSLRPLRKLSADVDQRHAEDTRGIEMDRIPDEIEPLISALNRLLERLGDSLHRERAFTDNAAHELRTPLAAMKTQAQILRRRLGDIPEHREGLNNLLSSIDRATHTLEQLLAFARLQIKDLPQDRFNLSELVGEVARELAPAATQKNQQLKVNCADNIEINGNREAMAILARNLLDNAIKYCPRKGRIWVSLQTAKGGPVFIVKDNGPGIPPADMKRVFERFYRGTNGQVMGSGLGLSIVKWVADQHGATLELVNLEPSGLQCTLTFKKEKT